MAKCAVCYGVLGHLDATFTSQCSHVFHPRCVSGRVACPSCSLPWYHTPTFTKASYSSYSLLPRPAGFPRVINYSTCAVCQEAVTAGASFISECQHTFHLTCVTGSVCPVCYARWAFHVSSHVSYSFQSYHVPPPMPPPSFAPVPAVCDDDEPLDPPAPHGAAPPLEDWDLVQDATDQGRRQGGASRG